MRENTCACVTSFCSSKAKLVLLLKGYNSLFLLGKVWFLSKNRAQSDIKAVLKSKLTTY